MQLPAGEQDFESLPPAVRRKVCTAALCVPFLIWSSPSFISFSFFFYLSCHDDRAPSWIVSRLDSLGVHQFWGFAQRTGRHFLGWNTLAHHYPVEWLRFTPEREVRKKWRHHHPHYVSMALPSTLHIGPIPLSFSTDPIVQSADSASSSRMSSVCASG
jgi:hypothetical protein